MQLEYIGWFSYIKQGRVRLFYGSGYVVVDSLLIELWGSVFVPCFVAHCSVSFLVLQSS